LELFISNSKYLEIKEKYGVPVIGDILISAVGTIGETLIIRDNSPFYFKDGNIVWLRNIQGVDPHFLKIALDSIVDNLKGVTRGAAYNALTIEKLKQIDFFFPKTLAEQQRIVERLDSLSENVRKYEKIQRQIISECDALKQALLRKVFE
jgi:type I restriction enzyme S subunit